MPNLQHPNILLIITDQFHPRCLGYAGHPLVQTPNIDRLAASGTNFSRMYSNQPLCMPTRATMFTGLTPRGHRVRMNGIPLDPAIPTFTDALRQAGYRTHSCGKIHLDCGVSYHGELYGRDADGRALDVPQLWKSGKIKDFPSPYYGLESIDLCESHGHGSYGHYLEWLRSEHPDQAHLFFDAVPLEPPSPARHLFNRLSYKWALPAELHPMTWITDRAIGFMRDAAQEQKSGAAEARPFCLLYSIQEPHLPFAPPAPYCHRYKPEDVPPPLRRDGELDRMPPHFKRMREEPIKTSGNNGEPMNCTDPYHGECAAHYFGLIEMLDDQVGRVMQTLEETGLKDNTVVIFTADHGECLGDHGLWGKGPYHYDSVIRVPFLVSWPERVKAGAIFDEPVSLLDYAPTILDFAGVPIPEGLTPPAPEAPEAPPPWPGRSLAPIARGETSPCDMDALVEMDEDYLGFKMRTLVTKRHRLTCYSGQTYGELFDLDDDPDEFENRWDDPAYREIRDALRLRLLDKIMQTDISVPRQLSRS